MRILRQLSDRSRLKLGRTRKKAMSASAKVKYKSVVRQVRREQIENAALKSVLKRGFPGSTLRVVAREAKVPLSFLHYYFRDKDELMRCVAANATRCVPRMRFSKSV